MTQTINIFENQFTLHAGGAVFWHEKEMLLIADVHFGKVTHFRKHGAAIPAQALLSNLEKLERVVTEFQPKTVCFLGDLFHSKLNSEWDIFATWVASSACDVVLINGNHDILPKYLFEDLGIAIFNSWETEDFIMT
nr:metallophosphoesterase [Flavobacteriales bacterium]